MKISMNILYDCSTHYQMLNKSCQIWSILITCRQTLPHVWLCLAKWLQSLNIVCWNSTTISMFLSGLQRWLSNSARVGQHVANVCRKNPLQSQCIRSPASVQQPALHSRRTERFQWPRNSEFSTQDFGTAVFPAPSAWARAGNRSFPPDTSAFQILATVGYQYETKLI